jgi:hypothetical protein
MNPGGMEASLPNKLGSNLDQKEGDPALDEYDAMIFN